MKNTLRVIITIMVFFFSSYAVAWNWVGHELVAQIAYDQLTPAEKKFWNKRVNALQMVYPREDFIRSSTLLDELRRHGINAFNSWHFINLPIVLNKINQFDHFHTNTLDPHNIISAIQEAEKIQTDRRANAFEKAFFASFLIHLVGDAHQPLHCAELYSHHFPHGDRGGNLFFLKNRKFHNLHSYWDQGGGFLSWWLAKNKTVLESTAQKLEKKYPKSWFGSRVNQLNPKIWVKESHDLAEKKAYNIIEYSSPSKAYQQQVQTITEEQIVLAGYRLALLLRRLVMI